MNPTDIKNPEYFHKVVDCQYACPAHTPVPEYIRLIAEEKDTEAGEVYLNKAQSLKLPTDNEKAMIELQLASIKANKGKLKEAEAHMRTIKSLKVTEGMIKNQIEEFDKALKQNKGLRIRDRRPHGHSRGGRPGRRRARDGDVALDRRRQGRYLRLELRRLHDVHGAHAGARGVQGRRQRRPRDRLGWLRHRLHRTVHGHPPVKPGGLPGQLGTVACCGPARKAAARPWDGR